MGQTLNDQVGYISVARNVLDTGKLDSSIIYPSTLLENATKNYLYLPGHYLALAATFKIFGYSPAHSLWPSLVSFLLSSALVVIITSVLFGRTLVVSSWLLFVFFPLNMVYAFTAMAELTVLASVLVALAVFLWLPTKWKPWLGPATLAIPLLFRETGIVIAMIMAAIVYKQSGHKRAPVTCFCVLSVLVAGLVLTSPVAKGRPSLVSRNLFSGAYEAVYSDATFSLKAAPTAAAWVSAIRKKFLQNAAELMRPSSSPARPDSREVHSLYFIAGGIPLALWLWWRKRDVLYLSIFLMLASLLCAILSLYTVWLFRGVRVLLMTQPVVAMLWAVFLADLGRMVRLPRSLAWLAASLWIALCVASVYLVFNREAQINAQSAQETAFLESLKPDPFTLMVSPWNISLNFVLKHHPVKWAFVPANDETLRILNSKYTIGTLVLESAQDSGLGPATIASLGLVECEDQFFRGRRYHIFKSGTSTCVPSPHVGS